MKQKYMDLRKSEKKVADYVLEHFEEVEKMVLDELANQAKVSQPTVMRFLKCLGFTGFKEFKMALMEERISQNMEDKKENDSIQGLYGYQIPRDAKVEELPGQIVRITNELLQDTLKNISAKSLEKVIEAIRKSNIIMIFGVENSIAVAHDLATKLIYLGYRCAFYSDTYLQTVSAGNLQPGDVAIAISYSGMSKSTVDTLEFAKKAGAVTVLITNFENTPGAKYADLELRSSGKQLFYGETIFSRTTQIAINDMIYMGVLLQDYKRSQKRLDQSTKIVRSNSYEEN
ncbi:MAG: MurR/RpiR family transcriptional regulator [Muricomes sp.]